MILIIYAHPNKDGHCGFMLKRAIEELDKARQEYKILDLYQMNYNPVLLPDEHYTSGRRAVAEENLKIQQLIKNNNKFIFIYPTWWNSPPAILKGFFDRIMVPRFAFQYEGKLPKSLLAGRAIIFTSTGAPRIITKIYYKDASVKFLSRDVLGFCGIRAKGFIIDLATKFTDKQKEKISKKVKKGISWLL